MTPIRLSSFDACRSDVGAFGVKTLYGEKFACSALLLSLLLLPRRRVISFSRPRALHVCVGMIEEHFYGPCRSFVLMLLRRTRTPTVTNKTFSVPPSSVKTKKTNKLHLSAAAWGPPRNYDTLDGRHTKRKGIKAPRRREKTSFSMFIDS